MFFLKNEMQNFVIQQKVKILRKRNLIGWKFEGGLLEAIWMNQGSSGKLIIGISEKQGLEL
jgi:hypothetical protein